MAWSLIQLWSATVLLPNDGWLSWVTVMLNARVAASPSTSVAV